MNTKHPKEDDARLTALLREWKPDADLPPRFQEGVWRRIAQAEDAKKIPRLAGFWREIEAALRRPALAACYVAILLFVGLGAGMLQAREQSARMDRTLEARYLQSVDPYLKTR